MNVPVELRYTSEHEWAAVVADSAVVRVGITDYAQDALGDVVFVDLPAIGTKVGANEMFGELESTKSVSELYAPVSGTVSAVNEALNDSPGLVNEDPYGDGWLLEIRLDDGVSRDDVLNALLDVEAYQELIEG